jgi:ABC-2 type transport system ATP-binding protein
MNSLLSFKNILKSYQGKQVLKNLDFSINQNSFVGLIGNNGCGKTTTIHILCNLITYESGEYHFEEKKVTPQYVSFKNKLGIVLSKPYYIEEFSVVEYWKFVAKFQYVP